MKRVFPISLALAITLTGCTTSETEPAPTSSTTSSSSSAAPTTSSETSTTATSSSEEETTVEQMPATSPEPAPVEQAPQAEQAPPVQQAPAEPTVVECLEGTPGPALWSDGSMAYSQWCFDTRGGAQVVENERNAGLNPPPAPEPQQPSPWVQGQLDWVECMENGGTEETCRYY